MSFEIKYALVCFGMSIIYGLISIIGSKNKSLMGSISIMYAFIAFYALFTTH